MIILIKRVLITVKVISPNMPNDKAPGNDGFFKRILRNVLGQLKICLP